jgi:hypothetical protein
MKGEIREGFRYSSRSPFITNGTEKRLLSQRALPPSHLRDRNSSGHHGRIALLRAASLLEKEIVG